MVWRGTADLFGVGKRNRTLDVLELTDAELASRSVTGMCGNPATVVLAACTTSLLRDHRAVFLTFAAVTAAIVMSRLVLLFAPNRCGLSPGLWRTLLFATIILSAGNWGWLSAFTIGCYDIGNPNTTLMLLYGAAVAGAGVHLMIEKVSLALAYTSIILTPTFIVCVARGGWWNSLAFAVAFYFVFLAGQSRRCTASFWKAIDDRVELGRLAHHDALTGLANRLELERSVQLASRASKRADDRICLLYIDLDGFKQVNDRYTHRIGDLLLAEVAARLRQSTDPGATACRLGGDEFCVFLSGRLTEQDAEHMAARIQAELRRPACIEGIVIHPSASIGISFHPAFGIDLKDLLRTADQAMYRAKAAKGGGILSSAAQAAA